MNIPLFYERLENGFYKLRFTPLYNPNVLLCDRHESLPGSMPEAGKGVFVLVDTKRTEEDSFFVFVGSSGVTGEKATLCGKPNSRFNRVWHKESPGIPDDISEWDKAILIYDWEVDIETRAEQEGSAHNKEDLLIDVMYNEVLHLEKLLRAEVDNWPDLDLTNASAGENYFMPNPDSLRYDYYVDAVMRLLRMIT